jgi:hypothetical protein
LLGKQIAGLDTELLSLGKAVLCPDNDNHRRFRNEAAAEQFRKCRAAAANGCFSRVLSALGFHKDAVKRPARSHKQPVLLYAAKAEVRADLGQMDLPKQDPVWVVAMHAVKPGAAPTSRRPDVAITVATNAIGTARAHINEDPPIDRAGSVHVEHTDVTNIDHIELRLVGREANAIRPVHLGDYGKSLSRIRVDAKDVPGNFFDRFVPLVVALDSPARIGEPYRSIGMHGEIVRGVQRLSVVRIYQDIDGAVVLCAGDTPGQVLAGQEPSLPVSGVPVTVVRRLTKYAHLAGDLAPTEDPVVGNVGEEKISTVAEPDRPLQPAPSGPEPFYDLLPDDQGAETLIDNLDGRIRESDDRSIDLPCAEAGSTFLHSLNLVL